MAAKKTEVKTEKIEREYTIPLREKCRPVPRYKKTNKAIKSIKEFLARHMKVRDRNLKKIKLDRYLNEAVWARGIKKPLAKVKVKAIKEGDKVMAELLEMPAYLKFKKAREEKREQETKEFAESKKKTLEKVKENAEKQKAEKSKEASSDNAKAIEEKATTGNRSKLPSPVQEKEKKSAVIKEDGKKEKEMAREAKHEVKGKTSSQERREETTANKSY